MAASLLLTRSTRLLAAGDMGLLEDLLRAAGTWALVDGLAADVAGSPEPRRSSPRRSHAVRHR